MTRSSWLAAFPPARRDDLIAAFNEAVYFGRETLAKEARRKGGAWAEGRA